MSRLYVKWHQTRVAAFQNSWWFMTAKCPNCHNHDGATSNLAPKRSLML